MRKYLQIIVCTLVMCFLYACKKDTKIAVPDSVPEPDFTLLASDLNFAIGTTWVYNVRTQTLSQDLINQMPPNVEMTSNSTYTVKVMYDTLIAAGINGKVLQYFFNPAFNGTFKELQFVNNTNNLWNQTLFGSSGTNSISPGGNTIKLPLTTNTQWKNPYYPSQSNLDTCYTLGGFENLQLSIGYLKCIHFMSLGMGNNYKNEYWYNKTKGLTQAISKTYTYPSTNILKTQASTLTLTKFN